MEQPEKIGDELNPAEVQLVAVHVTEVSPEQPENAPYPMLVTLSGIVTEVSPEQPQNALSPMRVTLSGIVIEVNSEQP